MTSIAGAASSATYFQSASSAADGKQQADPAKTGGASAGGTQAASASAASSSGGSSTSTESASTKNADGTYGPNHTAAPPANSAAAEKLAEARRLDGAQTETASSGSSTGVNILA